MIKSQRLRLTAQFAVTTLCIYIVLFALGLVIFENALTNSLDSQLETLLAQLSDEIEYDDSTLSMPKSRQFIRSQPMGMLSSVQLLDNTGKVLIRHGLSGSDNLVQSTDDFKLDNIIMRSRYLLLRSEKGTHVGYLQVQLPTSLRDRAVSNYATTMGLTALLSCIVLSVAGYVFALLSVKPIERSYKVLRQFTADAAHELGTPIATIAAAVENMKEEVESGSHLESRLFVIDRSVSRMDKLVQDLMLLTRLGIETDRPSREPELVDLKGLIEEIIEDFADRYQRDEIALQIGKCEALKTTGYRDNLERLLVNLLENALKYTDCGGTVIVGLESVGVTARLSVKDTGVGIPEDSLSEIFDRFYRVDKARLRTEGGNGLGLAIVKAIVDLHDGQVEVKSRVNEGTTFSVTLPQARRSQSHLD